jgi:hypothetical protein
MASGIKLSKFYFQIRPPCVLMSAFNKNEGTKKMQANAFSQAMLFIEKIANNENLSS